MQVKQIEIPFRRALIIEYIEMRVFSQATKEVEALCDADTDLEKLTSEGLSALFLAIFLGHDEISAFLSPFPPGLQQRSASIRWNGTLLRSLG